MHLMEIPKGTLKLPLGSDAIRMGVSAHGLWVETHTYGECEPTSARLYHTLPRPAGEWVAAGSLDHSSLHYAGGALTLSGTHLLLDGEYTGLELEGRGASAYAPCWLEHLYEKVEFPKNILRGALRLKKLFGKGELTLALTRQFAYLAHRKFIIRLRRADILCEIDPSCDHGQLLPNLRSNEVYLDVWGWWAQPKSGRLNTYSPHLEFRPNRQPPQQFFEIEESFAAAAALRQPDEIVVPWDALGEREIVPANMLPVVRHIFAGQESGAQARTCPEKPIIFDSFQGVALMIILP